MDQVQWSEVHHPNRIYCRIQMPCSIHSRRDSIQILQPVFLDYRWACWICCRRNGIPHRCMVCKLTRIARAIAQNSPLKMTTQCRNHYHWIETTGASSFSKMAKIKTKGMKRMKIHSQIEFATRCNASNIAYLFCKTAAFAFTILYNSFSLFELF